MNACESEFLFRSEQIRTRRILTDGSFNHEIDSMILIKVNRRVRFNLCSKDRVAFVWMSELVENDTLDVRL